MGVAVEGNPGVKPGVINEECDRTHPSREHLVPGLTLPPLSAYGATFRYFEIYTRGVPAIEWSVSCEKNWVTLLPSSGSLSPDAEEDQRVYVQVNWDKVPVDFNCVVHIDVVSKDGAFEQVHLPVDNRRVPSEFHGHVESEGHISLEPAAAQLHETQEGDYQVFPYVGRTTSGSIGLSAGTGAEPSCLEFPVYLFSSPGAVTITLYFTMVFDTRPDCKNLYDIALGSSEEKGVHLIQSRVEGELPVGWDNAVQDGVWKRTHIFKRIGCGANCVRYRPLTKGLLLENIVLDLGSVRPSYLAPPKSQLV